MKYTNKFGFPEYVVEWLKFDEYDLQKGAISATSLMKPPKMYVLEQMYSDDIEIEVSDLVASRYGTAIHDSVEKVKLTNAIQEKRIATIIDGAKIVGKFDIMLKTEEETYKLVDVKSTSVWTYIYGSKDEDYVKQLSIYRLLGVRNGYPVEKDAEIFMVFTDWSPSKAKREEEYPDTRVKIKKIKLWSIKETEEWIEERLRMFRETAAAPQKDMPDCNEEELWGDKTTYAVMKKGRKTAVRVLNSELEADTYIERNTEFNPKDLYVEKRPAKVRRCNYCKVKEFCKQYGELKSKGLIIE